MHRLNLDHQSLVGFMRIASSSIIYLVLRADLHIFFKVGLYDRMENMKALYTEKLHIAVYTTNDSPHSPHIVSFYLIYRSYTRALHCMVSPKRRHLIELISLFLLTLRSCSIADVLVILTSARLGRLRQLEVRSKSLVPGHMTSAFIIL